MIRLAVAGVPTEKLESLAGRLRGAAVVAFDANASGPPSYETLDAVAILAPSGLAAVPQAERLLAAGRHVMLTAHPALSHDTLIKLGKAAKRGEARLAVMNPEFDLPSRTLVKQQVIAGKLGEIGLMRLHRWESVADSEAHQGRLASTAWQDLSLAQWLINRWPCLVFAVGSGGGADISPGTEPRAAQRYVQLHLSFPGGAMALLDHYHSLPPGDRYSSLCVIGSSGAAYADDRDNMQLLYQGGRPVALRTEESMPGPATTLQRFIDSLRSNQDMAEDLAVWRRLGAVADALIRSLESGRAVQPEVV